jgi:hypothetical protein
VRPDAVREGELDVTVAPRADSVSRSGVILEPLTVYVGVSQIPDPPEKRFSMMNPLGPLGV